MDRFVRLSPEDRAEAFVQVAATRGLSPGSVEKDFWVCLMLRELFALPERGGHLTFKGGTSLSKAWGLIDRFSEDIDLTIGRDSLGFGGEDGPEAAASGKEKQRRLQRLKEASREVVVGQVGPALTARLRVLFAATESWTLDSGDEDPDGQTLLFGYPRLGGATTPSYVQPVVKLEFGARSDPWPVADRPVTSIVAGEIPQLFDTPACTVRALLPERTFWEKVMLLHEETFRPAGSTRRPRMARHYYDVWRLIETGVAARATADPTLFGQVAAHRQVFFKHAWVDYATLTRGAIRMLPQPEQLEEWRRDYMAMQGEMFIETPPAFEDMLARIAVFQSEFNSA